MIDCFCSETLKALEERWYVYALVDPRFEATDPRRYFYVGMGTNNRCFAHAREELKWERDRLNPKLEQIREIRGLTGQRPPIEIVRFGLSRDDAFALEAILIALLKTDANAVGGRGGANYCHAVEEVDAWHRNPIFEAALGARVLLVNLNGGGNAPPWPRIAAEDIDRRVLGDWPVSEANASEVQFLLGVYDKRVVCVYQVLSLKLKSFKRIQHGLDKRSRPIWKVRFEGTRASDKELEWLGRSVINDRGEILTKFPPQQGRRLAGSR